MISSLHIIQAESPARTTTNPAITAILPAFSIQTAGKIRNRTKDNNDHVYKGYRELHYTAAARA